VKAQETWLVFKLSQRRGQSFPSDPQDVNRALKSRVKAFAPCAGMAPQAFPCFSVPD
jgi:hypothetical protein